MGQGRAGVSERFWLVNPWGEKPNNPSVPHLVRGEPVSPLDEAGDGFPAHCRPLTVAVRTSAPWDVLRSRERGGAHENAFSGGRTRGRLYTAILMAEGAESSERDATRASRSGHGLRRAADAHLVEKARARYDVWREQVSRRRLF